MIATKTKSTKKRITVNVEDVTFDDRYYPRLSGVDWVTIARYTDAMRMGEKFPPITVVRKGEQTIALDGRHRCGAAHRAKLATLPATLIEGLPESEWYVTAVSLNMRHGRTLSYQDRLAIADRLKRMGFDMKRVAELLSIPADRLAAAAGRVVGRLKDRTVLKSAVSHLAGTAHQREAVNAQATIANASPRRTLDEMLALLASHAFDLDAAGIADKLRTIRDKLTAMKL